MIIVNQDKDLIVNFENVTVIGIAEGNCKEIASITTNGEEQFLGEYETEERAKEVLNEIRKVYKCSESYKHTRDFTTQGGIVKRMDEENLQVFVYQMPEE